MQLATTALFCYRHSLQHFASYQFIASRRRIPLTRPLTSHTTGTCLPCTLLYICQNYHHLPPPFRHGVKLLRCAAISAAAAGENLRQASPPRATSTRLPRLRASPRANAPPLTAQRCDYCRHRRPHTNLAHLRAHTVLRGRETACSLCRLAYSATTFGLLSGHPNGLQHPQHYSRTRCA